MRSRPAPLTLAGTGVNAGRRERPGYLSSVSTFQLQGTSPQIPSCSSTLVVSCIAFADDRSADLRYVGSASDAGFCGRLRRPGPASRFGVSSFGPWRTPASYTEFDVLLETDATSPGPDAIVYNTRLRHDGRLRLLPLGAGRPSSRARPVLEVLDDQLLNGADGAFDTNLFNSDSLVLPVSVGALQDAGLITGGCSEDQVLGRVLHRRGRSGRRRRLRGCPDDAQRGLARAVRRRTGQLLHAGHHRPPGRGARPAS